MEVDHARSGKQGAGGCEVFLREDSVGGIDAIELSNLDPPGVCGGEDDLFFAAAVQVSVVPADTW